MVISDLSHLEVVSEDNNIVGGEAISNAAAKATAKGPNFSGSSTNIYTNAFTSISYIHGLFSPSNYSSSSSSSNSAAA